MASSHAGTGPCDQSAGASPIVCADLRDHVYLDRLFLLSDRAWCRADRASLRSSRFFSFFKRSQTGGKLREYEK